MSLDELTLHLKRDVDITAYEIEASQSTPATNRMIETVVTAFSRLRMRSIWKEHHDHI